MTTKFSSFLGRLEPALFLLLVCWVANVSSSGCFAPCNISDCPPKDLPCAHGTVMDACECCEICAVGEGEGCMYAEECAEGLDCVKDIPAYLQLTEMEIMQYPGVCTAPTAQPSNGVTTEDATADEAAKCAQLGFVQATDTSTIAEPSETAEQCREECSVEFCSDSRKHKICSAKGMEFSHVAGRGTCQHTSCRACFLLIQPPCSANCPEPPTKQCLQSYQKCVRNHIFGFGSNNLFGSASLLALDDPDAMDHVNTGKVICYVTDMIA